MADLCIQQKSFETSSLVLRKILDFVFFCKYHDRFAFGVYFFQGQLNEIPEVAVKRASYVNRIPFDQLENEAKIISKLQHTNIVKLLGYCSQEREKILVFEYMPGRSLDSFITGRGFNSTSFIYSVLRPNSTVHVHLMMQYIHVSHI